MADGDAALLPIAAKVLNLHMLPDAAGKMNRSLLEVGGEILAIPQFTLHTD